MSIDGNKIMSVAAAKVLYDDLRQRVNNKLEANLKGAANGLAELDSAGKVPANQLPSYVDDVLEFATLNNFPVTGESGKIYIALDTNLTYRWSGSTYTIISSSLALGETESTAYRGDRGAVAYNHATNKGNAYSKGLYKITTNAEGHVINAQNVIKQDITNLGIPGTVPIKVSQLQNDSGFISSYTETDPTVPDWAKSPTKPTYTANEVGALPDITIIPSKVSDLINDVGYLTQHQDISGKADIEDIPTKVSDLTNDAGYLTAHQDISGKADIADVPTKVSDLIDDSGHYTKPSGGIPASDLADGVIPDVPVQDVQVAGVSVLQGSVANIPSANGSTYGVVKVNQYSDGLYLSQGVLKLNRAGASTIKTGTDSNAFTPVTLNDAAAFYGLAKAAGDTTQAASSNAVGTYTNEAKSAIQAMLDVPSNSSVNSSIATAIGNIESFNISVAQTLPTENIQDHTIYLVPKNGETNDVYDEYIYINNNWEKIGNTQVDLTGYVRNTDYANQDTGGVVKIINQGGGGFQIDQGYLLIKPPSTQAIKAKINTTLQPIIPGQIDIATFYGLAYAAGDTTQSQSDNSIGTYTTEAKAAIRSMIGAENGDDIVKIQDTQPTQAGTKIWMPETTPQGVQIPTYAEFQALETSVNSKVNDVQIDSTSIVSNGTATIPIATDGGDYGLVKLDSTHGSLTSLNGTLVVVPAYGNDCKDGNAGVRVITPYNQHQAVFYGLAKAAGDTSMRTSNNAVGTYTDDAKTAIRSMLGMVSNTDYANSSTAGVVKVNSNYGITINNGIIKVTSTDVGVKNGANSNIPVVCSNQHMAVFYGLAKAAGDTTQVDSSNAVGTYTDDAKIAIRNMLGAIGTADYAGASNAGVIFADASLNHGLQMRDGELRIRPAYTNDIKTGTNEYCPVVPSNAHTAAFYGLAKAAGDTTQAGSSNAVGTYTENAKDAIKAMLDVGTVTETISGTTPTITATANHRYICGEVTSLNFTPCASGICDVRFTSGSTVAVLTIPNTVKWPAWFNPASLEANTIYELNVLDGVYGAVMAWPI